MVLSQLQSTRYNNETTSEQDGLQALVEKWQGKVEEFVSLVVVEPVSGQP